MSETSIILDERGIPYQAATVQPGLEGQYWTWPLETPSATGLRVTSDNALCVTAVMACVKVLAETIASLPLKMYKRLPDGGKEPAPDHPLYGVLHTQPNPWQTSFEFREMLMGHLALRGNAYAEIIPGLRGSVDQLLPMHPDRVRPEKTTMGTIQYTIDDPDRGERRLMQDEVFHVRGLSTGGVVGLNPIEAEKESIGLAMALETYAAGLFGNRAMPGGVLEHPGKPSEQAIANIRKSWGQPGLAGAHKTSVLAEGMKWSQLGMKNDDAQFLESRKYQVRDIARIFRMQPHKIGDLEDATYSNIEHEAIAFVTDTIRPWLVRIEQAISRDLIQDPAYFAEFLIEGLLRGDVKTRTEANVLQFMNGFLTINEARAMENRNPLPGDFGNQHYVPLNLVPVERAGAESEAAEPVTVTDDGDTAADAELAFKRDMVQRMLADGTIGDIVYNLTDLKALLESLGIPTPAEIAKPLLPVVAAQGRLVSGEKIENLAGELVGGDVMSSETGVPDIGDEAEQPDEDAEPPPGDDQDQEEQPPPFPPEPTVPPGPSDSESRNDSLVIFVEDATQRLVNAELIALGRHAEKADEDRVRFDRWVDTFYHAHENRVVKALTPVARATGMIDNDAFWAGAYTAFVGEPRDLLHASPPEDVLPEWRESRVQHMTHTVMEMISCNGATQE